LAAVQSEPMAEGAKSNVFPVTEMFWVFQRQSS
jgi:hypothetical protein